MSRQTLQKFLASFGCKSAQEIEADFAAKDIGAITECSSLSVMSRHLANNLVELLNAKLRDCAIEHEPAFSSLVFETVRKLVVRLLAAKKGSELDFAELSNAYEELLEMRLTGKLGAFKLVESVNEKRKRGVFYTPNSLARDVTIRALLPLLTENPDLESSEESPASLPASADSMVSVERILSLRIVDPSMGAGTFLRTTLDVLSECILKRLSICNRDADWNALIERVPASVDAFSVRECLNKSDPVQLKRLISIAVARNCLYGLDVDSAAVELARIGLAHRCGLPASEASLFENLRHGNALLGLWRNPADKEGPASSERQRRDTVCLQFFGNLIALFADDVPVEHIRARLNFFHWDLEFAEVFSGDNPGFDAVITNPPWEIEKANSREFFSRWDPDFMTLGKQAALLRQEQLIAQDSNLAEEWNYYKLYHEGFKNYLQKVADRPWMVDDKRVETPFCHQGGGDSNSYKLFLELSYFLLKTGGVVAQIVPSGLYSDKGATELRRLFLGHCRWLFLHGYHNREGIFPIHRSFKFCTMGAIKGGSTSNVSCSFMRVSPDQLAEKPVNFNVSLLRRLSQDCLSFTEVTRVQDLQLIEKICSTATSIGALQCNPVSDKNAESRAISFRREFDMTNDSRLFIESSAAQRSGYVRDIFGHWIKGAWRPIEMFHSRHSGEYTQSADGDSGLAVDDIERVLLPVYEGRMIGQYDWAKKAWLSGKGRRAEWAEVDFGNKALFPQYTIDLADYLSIQPERGAKIGYLAVGASTNARSCIAAMIGDWPCGNSVPVLSTGSQNNHDRLCVLLACLNSYVFDYLLRMRLSANNLNWFILKECLIPDLEKLSQCAPLISAVSELSNHNALRAEGFPSACTDNSARRARLRAFVEAVIADAYQVNSDDCRLILRGCQIDDSTSGFEQGRSIDKGFHRIDLHLPYQFRGPYLFARSFALLQENGLEWLFEHLSNDKTQDEFEKFDCMVTNPTERLRAAVNLPSPHNNLAELFSRIRSRVITSSVRAKSPEMGTVGSPL